MTQVTAQAHETRMVEILANMAENEDLPAPVRIQAAVHVVTFARGQPKVWINKGETPDTAADGASGLGTVGQEIEAARNTARLHRQLNALTARNIHPREWPADVVEIAGDMVAYYADDEGSR